LTFPPLTFRTVSLRFNQVPLPTCRAWFQGLLQPPPPLPLPPPFLPFYGFEFSQNLPSCRFSFFVFSFTSDLFFFSFFIYSVDFFAIPFYFFSFFFLLGLVHFAALFFTQTSPDRCLCVHPRPPRAPLRRFPISVSLLCLFFFFSEVPPLSERFLFPLYSLTPPPLGSREFGLSDRYTRGLFLSSSLVVGNLPGMCRSDVLSAFFFQVSHRFFEQFSSSVFVYQAFPSISPTIPPLIFPPAASFSVTFAHNPPFGPSSVSFFMPGVPSLILPQPTLWKAQPNPP